MDSHSNNNDRYHTKPTPSSESKLKGFSSAADDRSSTPTQQMDQLHLHPHSHHHHHQQLDDLPPPPAMLNPLEDYDPSRSALGPLSMLEPLNDSWIDSNQHQHEYQPVFDPSSTVLRSLEVDSVLGHSSFSSSMDPRMHSGDVHDTFDDNNALDSHLHQQQQPLSAEAFEPVVNEHWLPPAPKGDYVERFSHVLCADGVSPRLVYLSSFDALVEQRVDCVPQGHKFKISCESYCEDAKIVFRVRVYTLADGKYCLEFQRRAGDAFHFHSLYFNCLRKLSQENMIVLQQSLPPCFAPEPAVRFDPARAPETIELLRGMIASPYLDVSCEGLRSLCQFARQSQMHEPLFSAGALNIFLESMQSPNEETRRLATAGCASLIFHHGDACRRVVESGSVDTLVSCIVMRGANGGQADYSLQLVREMSRVLLHLAEELGPELLVTIKKADAATCIHNLEQSRDFVLRNDASRLRDLVGAH